MPLAARELAFTSMAVEVLALLTVTFDMVTLAPPSISIWLPVEVGGAWIVPPVIVIDPAWPKMAPPTGAELFSNVPLVMRQRTVVTDPAAVAGGVILDRAVGGGHQSEVVEDACRRSRPSCC